MIYNNEFRREIFEEYINLQNKIEGLKGIVQNSMEIRESDLYQQRKIAENIKNDMDRLQKRLEEGK